MRHVVRCGGPITAARDTRPLQAFADPPRHARASARGPGVRASRPVRPMAEPGHSARSAPCGFSLDAAPGQAEVGGPTLDQTNRPCHRRALCGMEGHLFARANRPPSRPTSLAKQHCGVRLPVRAVATRAARVYAPGLLPASHLGKGSQWKTLSACSRWRVHSSSYASASSRWPSPARSPNSRRDLGGPCPGLPVQAARAGTAAPPIPISLMPRYITHAPCAGPSAGSRSGRPGRPACG
jgi:hypothetical protein